MFICPHIFVCSQGCTHPHMPPYSSVHLCVLGCFACCGGCNGLPFVWDTIWGCLPFNYIPHPQSLVPCALVCFRDISMLYGHFLSVEGFGSVPPSVGSLGASALEMSICSFLYFFVVHYVSCFNYSSDYYSSSYSGIFWPVISDSGCFPDRVSSNATLWNLPMAGICATW